MCHTSLHSHASRLFDHLISHFWRCRILGRVKFYAGSADERASESARGMRLASAASLADARPWHGSEGDGDKGSIARDRTTIEGFVETIPSSVGRDHQARSSVSDLRLLDHRSICIHPSSASPRARAARRPCPCALASAGLSTTTRASSPMPRQRIESESPSTPIPRTRVAMY